MGKNTVKIGNQQLMKLLRMLKNKSSKIIYPQVIKIQNNRILKM